MTATCVLGDSPSAAALASSRIVAILRYADGGDIVAAISALRDGGVDICEVTADTPGALDAIERTCHDGLVGLGTVTTAAQVRDCAAAGGRFIISPGTDRDVITTALDLGVLPIPGVLTGTDVLQALAAGASMLKLFPAEPLGPSYLAGLRGPFRNVPFIPTGGITAENAGAYLVAGAAAVAVGSALVGRCAPADAADAADITARACTLRNLVSRFSPASEAAATNPEGTR